LLVISISTDKDIETIIRNFEDGLIGEDKLTDTLLLGKSLLGKSPDDFGYRVSVSKEDIDEFEDFFGINHHEG
jgi:hypothetical protein